MNKIFLIICLTIITPAFAVCPIESETVCELPVINNNSPIFNNKNSKTNMTNTQDFLQPIQNEDFLNNTINPNSSINYNSGCQFGMCLQNLNDKQNAR